MKAIAGPSIYKRRLSILTQTDVLAALLMVLAVIEPPSALAGGGALETVIYSFGGMSGDGAQPQAGLVADGSGAFYGVTPAGGTFGRGAAFKLSPPAQGQSQWTMTILYSFGGVGGDGLFPVCVGNLTPAAWGALFGTTIKGGAYGQGTVFQLTPPQNEQAQWTETVLYSFGGVSGDGAGPMATVTLDEFGALYGVTQKGGANNVGAAFKLTPPGMTQKRWTETILYSFSGADGSGPIGNLIFGDRGVLYGTTEYGGQYPFGYGTVFQLAPPPPGGAAWTETVLYSFGGPPLPDPPHAPSRRYEGRPQSGLIMDRRGALYGSSMGGIERDGTVYMLSPPQNGQTQWVETIIHKFGSSYGDYGRPYGGLIADNNGALYGSTFLGSVFKVTPTALTKTQWSGTVLHIFDSSTGDGSAPLSDLVFDQRGALYGTTEAGGDFGKGTVFKIQLLAPAD
jgi:uncharacterized repeat protein (TIGR03803 family)